jgi:hypothetical protein
LRVYAHRSTLTGIFHLIAADQPVDKFHRRVWSCLFALLQPHIFIYYVLATRASRNDVRIIQ